jgi:small redox-active disulfide protein 2
MMITIKVLGSGCPNCKKVEELARQAAQGMRVQAEFVKITDPNEFIKYSVLSTPGLVINEKLVSSGRIPTVAEITTFFADALETA